MDGKWSTTDYLTHCSFSGVYTKLMKQSFNESRNKKLMTTTPSENDVKQLDYMFAKNSNLIVKIA